MPAAPDEPLEQFRRFADTAKVILAPRTPTVPLPAFRRFVTTSKPVLLRRLPDKLAALGPGLKRLRQWLLPADLDVLKLAHLTYAEDAYTNLIAWSLSPETHPKTALASQQAWLASVGVPHAALVAGAVEPMVQVVTEDGRPDMVLHYPSLVVVVEAKTGSAEHETPGSRQPQSFSYPEAVRKKLGLAPDTPVHIVFLTPDARAAANPEAIPATYLGFAVALASVLVPAHLNEEVRSLFKLWLTHLATCAVPGGLDLRGALERLAPALEGARSPAAEASILAHLADVNLILTLLPTRSGHE